MAAKVLQNININKPTFVYRLGLYGCEKSWVTAKSFKMNLLKMNGALSIEEYSSRLLIISVAHHTALSIRRPKLCDGC